MAITNTWDNAEKTIIHMDVDGRWTWDELSQAMDETSVMLDSVKHIVYAIVELSPQSNHIPGNFIPNARNLMKKRHPRSGMTVFVGANGLVIGLWRVLERVYAMLMLERDFTFASSLDEAHTILRQVMERDAEANRLSS